MVFFLRIPLLAAAIAALPAANAVHWIFGGTQELVVTRLDPVVNPGTVGSHVHSITGGSGFGETYDYDSLVQSQCTKIVVPQDKSNYWTPKLYHFNKQNASLTAMPNSFNIYYLVRGDQTGDKIKAFPKGLKMVAGDPTRKTYDASSHADQAISYVCLDYSGAHNGDPEWNERPNFFQHNCPNGMRAQVFFPSCWDGKNLDSPDHKSHMSYPVENYNNGRCPSTHPVHLVSLFYEMIISVDQFSYDGPGSWVWASGDTTGYAFHGDFTNGWTDSDLLQSAIDDCPNAAGNVADCPHLAAVMDQQAAAACRYPGEIVNEDIGDKFPIAVLPGCNPVWDGTGTKPACPSAGATPSLGGTQEKLATGWTEVGCIAEATNGRALTGAQLVDATGMTKNKCAQFCQSKNFKFAGIEWSQECYCGNSFSNGASSNTVASTQCSNSCAGNKFETCGGPQRLTLLTFDANGAPAPSVSVAPSSSVAVPVLSSAVVSSIASTSVVSSSKSLPTISSSSVVVVSSVASSASSVVVSNVPSVSVIVSSSALATSSAVPTADPATSHVLVPVPPITTASSAVVTPSAVSSAVPSPVHSDVCGAPPPAESPVVSSAAAAPPVATGIPAGWASAGCVSDNGHRTLNARAMTSDSLTVAQCLNYCTKEGFSIAGIEYGRECYCGNSFKNDGGKPLDNSVCRMSCTGQKDAQCGGDWALSVFKKTSNSSRRAVKAKHFGRHHPHNTF
ncbi:unnamed protein product [Somion occarium]|uniref:WSC domain-containing protein n=1 Tax=Somion occarium TaxID=3059160 RepID=A0ABP1CXU0_9APHY